MGKIIPFPTGGKKGKGAAQSAPPSPAVIERLNRAVERLERQLADPSLRGEARQEVQVAYQVSAWIVADQDDTLTAILNGALPDEDPDADEWPPLTRPANVPDISPKEAIERLRAGLGDRSVTVHTGVTAPGLYQTLKRFRKPYMMLRYVMSLQAYQPDRYRVARQLLAGLEPLLFV